MKERFIKHIKHDLISGSHKYPFLSPEDLKLLRQGYSIEHCNILFYVFYFIELNFSLKVEVIDDNERKKKKSKYLHKNYCSDADTDNESE